MSDRVVFLFPGQGSQYRGMGAASALADTGFRADLEHVDQLVRRAGGPALLPWLMATRAPASTDDGVRLTHPAVFAVQYAATRLLHRRGTEPDAVLGMSLGEVAAAVTAGVLDVEQAVELVCHHADLVSRRCPPGGMTAVLAPASGRPNGCELVADNGPAHHVIGGSPAELAAAEAELSRRGVVWARLPVDRAFHTAAMDVLRDEVLQPVLRRARRPILTYVSATTGGILPDGPGDGHWWDVVRGRLRPVQALRAVAGARFVDIGPGDTFSALLRQNAVATAGVHPILTPYADEAALIRSVPVRHRTDRRKMYPDNESTTAVVFPGQGSQHVGMGAGLFERYPDLTAQADGVLGWSVRRTCLEDPEGLLDRTDRTQPALFVVGALGHLARLADGSAEPGFVAGHSLGEYTALFAAGVFDFAVGVRLVAERGRLMAAAAGGAMAVVVGLPEDEVRAVLALPRFAGLDLANFNTPTQFVVSGPRDDTAAAEQAFRAAGARSYTVLRTSGAFHSRYMAGAAAEFAATVGGVALRPPRIPVVANLTARPYTAEVLTSNLVGQIDGSVRWTESVRWLLDQGVTTFEQVGPGSVLAELVRAIRRAAPTGAPKDSVLVGAGARGAVRYATGTGPDAAAAPAGSLREIIPPAAAGAHLPGPQAAVPQPRARPTGPPAPPEQATLLGSQAFRTHHGLRYAYVAGSMYRGISSPALVARMARAGMLAFVGTGGMPLADVEDAMAQLRRTVPDGRGYGFNLLHSPGAPFVEDELVSLFLTHGVRLLEASAFMTVTPALVRYRLSGVHRGADGAVVLPNRVMAKVSRPEVAAAFLAPPPHGVVGSLLAAGRITAAEAELAPYLPMADDLTVESDSGGHTDGGVASALLPSMLRQRDRAAIEHSYPHRVRIGAAGGIGTPEAAAAAFVLGADYVVTGSVNQCTVEAGTSDVVKDLLAQINVQDTDYAPAGDMFELGSRVQVLKRGVFFPARANKLLALYRQHDSLDDIAPATRAQLEERYFKRSFDEVFELVRARKSAAEIARAEQSPKHRMLLVFTWYFGHSSQLALAGDPDGRVDYQVHCGPALGAYNQWVAGSALEDWRNRHADEIGRSIMREAAELLRQQLLSLTGAVN